MSVDDNPFLDNSYLVYSQSDTWVLISDTVSYNLINNDSSLSYTRILEVYIDSDKEYITELPLWEKRLWIIPMFEESVTDDIHNGKFMFRINFKCFTFDYDILQIWNKPEMYESWKEIKIGKDIKMKLEKYLSAGDIKQKLFDYVCNLK